MFGIKKKSSKYSDDDFSSFRAIVNTHRSNLNIRSTPSKKIQPITTAPKGARILVYGKEGDWYKIVYRGLKGYAYQDYIMPLDIMNSSH